MNNKPISIYEYTIIGLINLLHCDNFFNLNHFRSYREKKGGYWEKWYIDCVHSEMWFSRTLKEIRNKERPGCAFGTPTVEYYDLNYYGVFKKDFDIEKLIRLKKIKSVI